LGMWIWICVIGKKNKLDRKVYNVGRIAAGFGIVAMIFSLSAFPWTKIQFVNQLTMTLVSSLEFPHRFLTIGTLVLTIVSGVVGKYLWTSEKKTVFQLYAGFMSLLLLVSSVYYMNDLLNTGSYYRVYNSEGMGTGYVSSGEYLPYGTDTTQLLYKEVMAEENIVVSEYQKAGLSAVTKCSNQSEREGYLQYPILYYKGYTAFDEGTGEKLPLYDGNNHMVSVAVPAGYDGTIIVEFVSPWYWRVAEVLSLLAFLVFIGYIYKNSRAQKKLVQKEENK